MIAESSRASVPVCAPSTIHFDHSAHGSAPLSELSELSREERYRRFGDEIDAVKQRAVARLGAEDVAYVRRLNRFSRGMEIAGLR